MSDHVTDYQSDCQQNNCLPLPWTIGEPDQLARFASKVIIAGPDDCWLWKGKCFHKGKKNPKGYGRFCYKWTVIQAHRVSYILAVGPIPKGLCVCHSCDNPPCVNPKHLWIGTKADNNKDMMAKGRYVTPVGVVNSGSFTSEKISGEKHLQAKLSDVQILELLTLAANGMTTRKLAIRFGLTVRYTNQLRSGHALRTKGNPLCRK